MLVLMGRTSRGFEDLLCDLGGEFRRELATEVESMGVNYKTTAAISPTQNAACERAGGAWKLHAKALMDEFSVKFKDTTRVWWMISSIEGVLNSLFLGRSPQALPRVLALRSTNCRRS